MSKCKACKKELPEKGNSAYFSYHVRTLENLLGAINDGKVGVLCPDCSSKLAKEIEGDF